jgi:4-amino-4-deoxy-L-arabinose transferase-like glycosyltransferase
VNPAPAKVPWWAAVFLVALAVRLAYLLGLREPLLYGDQYNYLFGALQIASHEDPLDYVLRSDDWRSWNVRWTRAPLYTLLAALPFRLFGPQLLPLQLLNVLLGALSAVLVGAVARRVTQRWGAWAGCAQALYWPAIELAPKTLSENLHTPLLLGALLVLARSADPVSTRRAALGGFLLGLSALARTVSVAFVPCAALWRWHATRGRAGALAALAVCAGAGAAILPWTARNVLFTKQAVLIDSVGSFNLWKDNLYDEERRDEWPFKRGKPRPVPHVGPAELARTLAENPAGLGGKIADNVGHLLRPEALHVLLTLELPQPAWRHAAAIVLDDGLLVLASSLFLVSLVAGPGGPARRLVLAWLACYTFMLVAVFHVEIRYRSALVPLLFAAAAGGLPALATRAELSGRRRRLALALAVLPWLAVAFAYGGGASRAVAARAGLSRARAALVRGDGAAAAREAAEAAARDPGSARPWILYAGSLARAGEADAALAAYERAERLRPDHWVPPVVRPQLLRAAGREGEAARALRAAQVLASRRGSWPALEIAWRELPPPRGDALELPRDELGGARGLHDARGGTRWTSRTAWLRLQPETPAAEYDVALELASPPPAPDPAPTVEVRVRGGPTARFTLERAFRAYALRVPAAAERPLELEIRAPVWLQVGVRAELGVAVRRMTVTPVR